MSKFLIAIALIAFSQFAPIIGIFQGFPAQTGQFPYYAYIQVEKHTPGVHAACAGALLSAEWVITAAHCTNDTKILSVHLGMSKLNEPLGLGRRIFRVDKKRIYTYPGYSLTHGWNDIALIHLPQKVRFSQKIQPVHLPTECASSRDTDVISMGNGAIDNRGFVSNQLHFSVMKTISLRKCREEPTGLSTIFFRRRIICAQDNVKSASICKGDSGGPLISKVNNSLIGVAFLGHDDGCEKGFPQGFISVYPYLKWIAKHTGLNLPVC